MSQAENSIVSAICNYFMECPLLKDGVFRVDALGDQPQEYSIEMGIGNAIVEQYVDGSSVRQKFFTFASRDANEENARYQIQLSLQYFKEA